MEMKWWELLVGIFLGMALALVAVGVIGCSTTPKCPEDCTCDKWGKVEWCPYFSELIDKRAK